MQHRLFGNSSCGPKPKLQFLREHDWMTSFLQMINNGARTLLHQWEASSPAMLETPDSHSNTEVKEHSAKAALGRETTRELMALLAQVW